jgi:hypothetical protein
MPVNIITHGQTVEVTSVNYDIGVTTGILPITDIYGGAYEITPSAAPQTVRTNMQRGKELTITSEVFVLRPSFQSPRKQRLGNILIMFLQKF